MTSKEMFRGELHFMSNFYPHEFYSRAFKQIVKSGEHSFNAFKSPSLKEAQWVLDADSPGEAKKRGRSVSLRPRWDDHFRDVAMVETLKGKFADEELARRLKATGDLVLVESNRWHDQYWGDCYCDRHSATPGRNTLGQMLMQLRSTL